MRVLPARHDRNVAPPELRRVSNISSQNPVVLYHASCERIVTARRVLGADGPDYVAAMYLAGLAVECILQAHALRSGASPDAGHSLALWLSRCPSRVREGVTGQTAAEWNTLRALWDNRLRYFSRGGLLGYLRLRGFARGISGGPEAIIRRNAKVLVAAAEAVHSRGRAQWESFTRR
ncbi:MAG: hypothetical protein HY721_12980 [Planctomycetes bacterium]|nr:hypothetical protein [Planctomycetota bacterium]